MVWTGVVRVGNHFKSAQIGVGHIECPDGCGSCNRPMVRAAFEKLGWIAVRCADGAMDVEVTQTGQSHLEEPDYAADYSWHVRSVIVLTGHLDEIDVEQGETSALANYMWSLVPTPAGEEFLAALEPPPGKSLDDLRECVHDRSAIWDFGERCDSPPVLSPREDNVEYEWQEEFRSWTPRREGGGGGGGEFPPF